MNNADSQNTKAQKQQTNTQHQHLKTRTTQNTNAQKLKTSTNQQHLKQKLSTKHRRTETENKHTTATSETKNKHNTQTHRN